jgi:hypothetical protein
MGFEIESNALVSPIQPVRRNDGGTNAQDMKPKQNNKIKANKVRPRRL